jgi:hypothetical protein
MFAILRPTEVILPLLCSLILAIRNIPYFARTGNRLNWQEQWPKLGSSA